MSTKKFRNPHAGLLSQEVPQQVAPGEVTPAWRIDTSLEGMAGLDHDASEAGVIASQHETTIFIRFTMEEPMPADQARQPSVLLQANSGMEVELTASYPSIASLNDGVNHTDAAAAARFNTKDRQGYLVKVWVHIPGITLKARIKNNDTVNHEFTWATRDNQAETRQAMQGMKASAQPKAAGKKKPSVQPKAAGKKKSSASKK